MLFRLSVYVSLLLAPTVKSDFLSLRLPALIFLTSSTVISIVCWNASLGVRHA